MWSGSTNHTKTNANAYGSGFLNPDSRIFMRTQDSHRIRTTRYGSPPPDPIGLELFLCKGNSASRVSEWTRECYALSPDHTIQVQYPPNSECHLLLPFYGNSPELIRYGRASIPTRLMSLGLLVRMPRCLS